MRSCCSCRIRQTPLTCRDNKDNISRGLGLCREFRTKHRGNHMKMYGSSRWRGAFRNPCADSSKEPLSSENLAAPVPPPGMAITAHPSVLAIEKCSKWVSIQAVLFKIRTGGGGKNHSVLSFSNKMLSLMKNLTAHGRQSKKCCTQRNRCEIPASCDNAAISECWNECGQDSICVVDLICCL